MDPGVRVVALLILAVLLGAVALLLGLTFWGASVVVWWFAR